jgi:hypothetical protein
MRRPPTVGGRAVFGNVASLPARYAPGPGSAAVRLCRQSVLVAVHPRQSKGSRCTGTRYSQVCKPSPTRLPTEFVIAAERLSAPVVHAVGGAYGFNSKFTVVVLSATTLAGLDWGLWVCWPPHLPVAVTV